MVMLIIGAAYTGRRGSRELKRGRKPKLSEPSIVTFAIERDLIQMLDTIAEKEKISRSELLRQLIQSCIEYTQMELPANNVPASNGTPASAGGGGEGENNGKAADPPVTLAAKIIYFRRQIIDTHKYYRGLLDRFYQHLSRSKYSDKEREEARDLAFQIEKVWFDLLKMISRHPVKNDEKLREVLEEVKELPADVEEVLGK
jgi:hypothetical protein